MVFDVFDVEKEKSVFFFLYSRAALMMFREEIYIGNEYGEESHNVVRCISAMEVRKQVSYDDVSIRIDAVMFCYFVSCISRLITFKL